MSEGLRAAGADREGRAPSLSPWRAYATIAVPLGAVALVLDRDPGDAITFWEEWLEMNGALALFFAAALVPASLDQEPRTQWVGLSRSRGFRVAFGACLAAATLCGVLLV